MGLKDILVQHHVELPSDFDERMDILVTGLRRDPAYAEKVRRFKADQRGGADEDWLGPKLNGVIDALTTPAARGVLQGLFFVVFFIKYLESTPVFGSILSAVLDVMIMGSKMFVKSVQKTLPPLIGLVPLPYASLFGIAVAAVFGMLIWPVLALVSFSRADFTAAIDSFLRVLPPPMGDMIADIFLEGNRTVSRLDEKRQKLASDISEALNVLSSVVADGTSQVRTGMQSLSDKTQQVATTMPIPKVPRLQGGQPFSRRRRIHKKWRKTMRRK